MSDTPPERNSNSKSNLIEVQHVGVTAKLQSPLKSLMMQASSSSTETDNNQLLYHGKTSKYNKFSNLEETHVETETTTDTSKILYEMRAIRGCSSIRQIGLDKATPSKIEFQLYNKASRRRSKLSAANKRRSSKRKLYNEPTKKTRNNDAVTEPTLFQRLRHSFDGMRKTSQRAGRQEQKWNNYDSILIDDLPKPNFKSGTQTSPRDTRIGIYPFEHGCAEYLRTTDCHPHLLSLMLAERATRYATRFWAEFFGTLHIGVAFIVTFLLQSYRFLLYSLVNTLLVGFLHMTSDYLIKPILTVIFNGFLQPPLVLIYNIFASLRDILEPIADTANNFLKPVANVLRSVRLVQANYNHRKLAKNV